MHYRLREAPPTLAGEKSQSFLRVENGFDGADAEYKLQQKHTASRRFEALGGNPRVAVEILIFAADREVAWQPHFAVCSATFSDVTKRPS